jgi:hypothetical protein
MDTVTVVIIIVIILAVVAVGAALLYRRQRSQGLQERFGPEYRRKVEESGDRRAAERDLHERERRRSRIDVKPLSAESANRYRSEWSALQQRFVDEPEAAVADADRLVLEMMRERGYPMDEFDQRADDISVDHPDVAQNYREAHRVTVAQSRGEADTEQLRQAVTAYRRLVDTLLEDREGADRRQPSQPTDTKEQP